MDGKEAVRAHALATSIFRHRASLQNEIPPLRAPEQSASVWQFLAVCPCSCLEMSPHFNTLTLNHNQENY